MVRSHQHRRQPLQPVVWPARGTSQAVAAWPSPAQEDSTAARSDPLHPMGILCPSCWSGVIGWLGKTVSNVGQVRKGLGAGALEHPQGEEQARSGLQARLDRTHFYSTFCKNTCYWVRTGFVLYFIIISTLFWREKKKWWSALERGWEGSFFSEMLFVIQWAVWPK